MSDLQATISTISESELEKLFGDEPIKNINENDVVLGKSNVKVLGDDKDKTIKVGGNTNNIPVIDNIDDLFSDDKEITKKEESPKIDDKGEPIKKVEKKEEQKNQSNPDVVEVLKNTAKFLIDKGFWKDFVDSETVLAQLTEEGYAELATRQNEELRNEIREETIGATGDYGKAIIDYVENGGNPDEVIDIFKEQKRVESIAIDTEDGQKNLIEKYYTEVYDWTPEKTKKYINNLISSDELESEAKEVDTKYKEYFKQEVATLQLQAQADKKASQEREKAFIQTINNKLLERKDFTDKDRKLIQDSVFKYDAALADGTKVNRFYLKFAEMQKNPDDYLDLVNFVMDKEGYNKKVKTKEDSKGVDKSWKFLSKNSSVAKTTGSKPEVQETNTKSQGLSFSSLLNK